MMVGWGPHICILAVSFYFCALLAVGQVTDPSEVSALLALKNSLSDNMKHLANWKEGDPCISNWTGVLCFNVTATDGYLHVRELQLMNMNLSGNLVPELGRLSQLKKLNFMWNQLTGSIPKDIGKIASLRLLLLNGNKLSGSLAEELGYLFNLNRFQIDQNEISGPIPKSFSNLKNVFHLHFNNNSLSGQIPSELSNLSNLHHLLLDNNNISGFLPPEISKIPELRILQLDNNNFGGSEIPTSYGSFPKLVKLSLRNCSLRGPIPDLSRIQDLTYLDLSWNQLSGSIPSNKYSENMTTIDLSHNLLNGSIPESFSYLPSLQKLLLANNLLSGSISTEVWRNKSFGTTSRLIIDLRSNLFWSISGNLDPPANVTIRLHGNPICNNSNIRNIKQFCGPEAGTNDLFYNTSNSANSTLTCPVQACPVNNYFEYVPASPIPCFCAAPLRIGYRLKSPSFSDFIPYLIPFELYLTNSLNLHLYQLSIDSLSWEKGPRLRMYVKLFPVAGVTNSSTFNTSEVLRLIDIFSSWKFPPNDFYGPYELLNFTLLGPYSLYSRPLGGSKNKTVLIVGIVVAVASSVIISAVVTILITRRHTRYRRILTRRRASSKLKIVDVKSFTLKEMALATNDFDMSTKIGQGGYGNVYKGILADKTVVAIKRAREGSLQGENEFLTEIELLSRLHHRNLVALLGYCDEEGEQMLVYEFMPNGTLRDWLSAKSEETLNFGARLRIALGAAKGILYLHTEANPPIFHRDIKASNILLDNKFVAKVADFGLSRLAPFLEVEGTIPDHVSTVVKGTPGYVDPEYFLTRKLTDKSDVYSLGVVFLEILTGMHPITRGKNIVREVILAQKSDTIFSVLDKKMGGFSCESIEKFMGLALRCCEDDPEKRPSMLDVVRELENILQMMMPDAEIYSSDSRSKYHDELSLSPSSSNTGAGGKDLYPISKTSGALISGVSLTISPR